MPTKKPTILLADDYPPMLKLLSRVLEIEGYRVVTARDGPTALKLAGKKKSLQLVILGIEDTEPTGIEVCRRLRKFSSVPVIILAAKYEPHDIACSLEAGADEFVAKPFATAQFITQVKAVLRRHGF